jgi:alanine transaminase
VQDTRDQILKMASINLCPNVSGQICCTLMMTPPRPGEPSYELYQQEKQAILGSLKRRCAAAAAAAGDIGGARKQPAPVP